MFAKWWDNLKECCDLRLGIGAGSAVAWALVLAVSPIVSPESTLSAGEQSWRLAAVITAGVGFACLSYLSAHRRTELQDGAQALPLIASGAVLAPLGALILRLSDTGPLALVAGVALGWSLTSLAASWMGPFVPLSLRKRVAGTVVAAFAGCLLYLAACLLPYPLSFVISLPLAPLSFGLRSSLGKHRSTIADDRDEGQNTSDPSSDVAKSHALGRELTLSAFVFGALFVLAGHVIPELESEWMASALPGIANVAAFLLLETLITLYMVRRIRHENPRVAYRPSVILVAAGFLLVPFCPPSLAIGCSAIAFAGFGSFLVYLWIVVGNFCQKWHAPGIGAASGAFLALFVGLIFGEIISWTLLQLRNPGFDYLAAISIVALFMLVVLTWSMSNGAQYAHETLEMGGRPYEEVTGIHASGKEGDRPDDEQVLQALAKHYGLSPREIEILALLVKGRSIPYICDELFIAKSTAQTHVRHIYGKMEITEGRQELLDRFESEAVNLTETPAA